jgi:hypothetical protein
MDAQQQLDPLGESVFDHRTEEESSSMELAALSIQGPVACVCMCMCVEGFVDCSDFIVLCVNSTDCCCVCWPCWPTASSSTYKTCQALFRCCAVLCCVCSWFSC